MPDTPQEGDRLILPVGVGRVGRSGCYRIVVYYPGFATAISSVKEFHKVQPEIHWLLNKVYGHCDHVMCHHLFFEIKIHREKV